MSSQATALLALSPRTSGSFADRVYRLGSFHQLVEGGSSAYWLSAALEPIQHHVSPLTLQIETPVDSNVVDSVVLLAAVHTGDAAIEGILLDTANIELRDEVREIVPYWELEDGVRTSVAKRLAEYIRIAVTILDEPSLMTEQVVEELRSLGFDLDVFTLTSSVQGVHQA